MAHIGIASGSRIGHAFTDVQADGVPALPEAQIGAPTGQRLKHRVHSTSSARAVRLGGYRFADYRYVDCGTTDFASFCCCSCLLLLLHECAGHRFEEGALGVQIPADVQRPIP